MKLYNTLTRKTEKFEPIEDKKVSMYTCGPTVYDVAHIGNLRKYICDDLLYRALIFDGYQVKRVMNITDVDDKTIKRAEGNRQKFEELTTDIENHFFSDLDKLNIIKPDPENITRATAYIDKIVAFIEDLLRLGYAYKTADGSVYFSIAKFKDYGKLSQLKNREIRVGARVAQDEYDKENPSDFALWKAWDEEDGEIYWNTALGKGRPGWHIECSTMAMDKLGVTIDIHTGGVDNIFPHHENEIAQSEARTSKKFVNFWIHNEFLLVDNQKMSKSLGNFHRLSDIEKRGFSPLDFRYFVLGAHYRSKLNFTWEGLESARNTREKLESFVSTNIKMGGVENSVIVSEFMARINDDLNLPEALAVLHRMLKNKEMSDADKAETAYKLNDILGLDFDRVKVVEIIPDEVKNLADQRKTARENKDFAKSDELRSEIEKSGWSIEDLSDNKYKLIKK